MQAVGAKSGALGLVGSSEEARLNAEPALSRAGRSSRPEGRKQPHYLSDIRLIQAARRKRGPALFLLDSFSQRHIFPAAAIGKHNNLGHALPQPLTVHAEVVVKAG